MPETALSIGTKSQGTLLHEIDSDEAQDEIKEMLAAKTRMPNPDGPRLVMKAALDFEQEVEVYPWLLDGDKITIGEEVVFPTTLNRDTASILADETPLINTALSTRCFG